jgi:hypothetical protein
LWPEAALFFHRLREVEKLTLACVNLSEKAEAVAEMLAQAGQRFGFLMLFRQQVPQGNGC